jgi:hypothetical protein
MDLKTVDKRLQERLLRKRAVAPDDLSKAMSRLKDHSDAVRRPADHDLERLRQELPLESEIRAGRIVRAVERQRLRAELEPEELPVPAPEPEAETERKP